MRGKELDFAELYDVRAFRVIVDDVQDCYTALGMVHNIWTPIPKEFDDYISRPKANSYQSLHTAVIGRRRACRSRCRSARRRCTSFAEYGVAAHWRYKEERRLELREPEIRREDRLAAPAAGLEDATWPTRGRPGRLQREWVEKLKSATLDDRIYVLTPQARVIELPRGADADRLRLPPAQRRRPSLPRRASRRRDGAAEHAAEERPDPSRSSPPKARRPAGPSRDWLSRRLHASAARTRAKVRAWFNAQRHGRKHWRRPRAGRKDRCSAKARPRSTWRRWRTSWASPRLDELFLAVGKEEFSLRHIEHALHADEREARAGRKNELSAEQEPRLERGAGRQSGVLVVGTEA